MHRIFTGGIAQTNGYLIPCPNDKYILIDAPDGICEWLMSKNIKVTDLLLTHQHFDHVIDAAALQAQGVKIHAFAQSSPQLTLDLTIKQLNLPPIAPYHVDEILADQSSISIHGHTIQLAHVPGHSPDSLTYHFTDLGQLYCGDTLFAESIGRTDLPGHGDHQLLLRGIRDKIFVLPAETHVHPGHGPSTTVGAERQYNPYF